MFIDFSTLDFEKLKSVYADEVYYSQVILFLDTYLYSDGFKSQTSGSTGEPKYLEISNLQAEESARISNAYFKIDLTTHFLLCLDIRYIGSKLMLIRAKIAGAKITILPPSLKFYEFIVTEKYDFISLTPLHVIHILDHCPDFFQQIKTCLIGSSGVSPNLESRLRAIEAKAQFYESYAMTETVSHFALRNISAHETCFTILTDFQISINDDSCLEIYHPIIVLNKITTTDIVELISPTQLKYIGRQDNIININGLKINPETLENEWSEFLDFKFIVAGEPENSLGQQLIIILKDKINLTLNEIHSFLESAGISHKYFPKVLYFSTDWVMTESLKPKRKEIFLNRIV
jgi:o-succinylbenzoate---CoA ligase